MFDCAKMDYVGYWLMFIISLQIFFNPCLVPRLVLPARVFPKPHLFLGRPVERAALIPRFFSHQGLEMIPKDCWATHALAHVMEMEGRQDEGIEFMSKTQDDWVVRVSSCENQYILNFRFISCLVRYIIKYSCRPTLRDASW